MLLVTPIYAAIFGLFLIVLSLRVIRLRQNLAIPIGDGGNPELARGIGVHANFAEYVPLALILLYFLEGSTGAREWIHTLCLALLAGRVLHAYGVSQLDEKLAFRVAGMMLTFGVIATACLVLIVLYIFG